MDNGEIDAIICHDKTFSRYFLFND